MVEAPDTERFLASSIIIPQIEIEFFIALGLFLLPEIAYNNNNK